MQHVRKSTVSGMFYDARKQELQQQIKNCFLKKPGPGNIGTPEKTQKKLRGVVVPHAGYFYSGGIAAHSYNAIIEHGYADTYIILGPNHHGLGSGVAMSSGGSWDTPLGEITIDEHLVQLLSGGIIDIDDDTLSYQENSIEVQLPFLQFISENKPFSIVPIAVAMQDYETAVDIGNQIAEAIEKENKHIIIIASSDFSHEGIAYGKMPPGTLQANTYVEQQDQHAIKHILDMNPMKLIDTVYEKNISMCGYGPIAAMLTASKKLGATTVELLKYGTSYDVSSDSNACVGYASFAVY